MHVVNKPSPGAVPPRRPGFLIGTTYPAAHVQSRTTLAGPVRQVKRLALPTAPTMQRRPCDDGTRLPSCWSSQISRWPCRAAIIPSAGRSRDQASPPPSWVRRMALRRDRSLNKIALSSTRTASGQVFVGPTRLPRHCYGKRQVWTVSVIACTYRVRVCRCSWFSSAASFVFS